MTLEEVELPVGVEWARSHALVFSADLAARLSELHAEHGSTNLILMPRQLTDGRLMLCADCLTEVGPGGLLNGMWEAADQAILLPAVEVIPLADAVALLPPETPIP